MRGKIIRDHVYGDLVDTETKQYGEPFYFSYGKVVLHFSQLLI